MPTTNLESAQIFSAFLAALVALTYEGEKHSLGLRVCLEYRCVGGILTSYFAQAGAFLPHNFDFHSG